MYQKPLLIIKKNHTLKGLTLIELLMTVCVIGILAAIAYPSYQSQLYKIRRSEGQQALLLLANDLEINYLHNKLEQTHAKLETEYYYLNIALSESDHTYILSATPKADTAQKNDPCGTLSFTDKQVMGPHIACWE